MRAIILFAVLVLLVGSGCIQPPVAPEVKCNDSEIGVDIYNYGYVTYNRLTYADSCQGTSRVTEYYCVGNELQSESQDCPEGYICREGACIVTPCEDSDEGKDFNNKGTTAKGEDAYSDYCLDNSVVEYYCVNNEISSIVSPCAAGYVCIDGACIVSRCEDTESGRTSAVAGTVTKDNISYTDYCSGSTTVFEYYCGDSGDVASTTIACSSGYVCSEGICVRCGDSDGGQNMYTRGTVVNDTGSSTDYCINNVMLNEYYCSDGAIKAKSMNCISGYTCLNGACVESPGCSDSDGGQDRYTKGTTMLGDDTYTDYCSGERQVTEYYCSGDNLYWNYLTCPPDYTCINGRCVRSAVSCSDSDGIDVYTYGQVTRDSSTYNDVCTDTTHVREYWCDGTDVEMTIYECPSGYECSGGRCVAGCIDTDGEDIYLYGTVWVGDTAYSDACVIDNDHVRENYCSAGAAAWSTYSCPDGYVCSGGACVEGCEETDSGDDPAVAGTTMKGTKSYVDTCLGSSTLVEFYCSGGFVDSVHIGCTGVGCVDGYCVSWIR